MTDRDSLQDAIQAHQARLARMRDSRETLQGQTRHSDDAEPASPPLPAPAKASAPMQRSFEERRKAGLEAEEREAKIVARTLLKAADAVLRCEGDETTLVRAAQKLHSMVPTIHRGNL